jgi:AcrR family transcriptional regulator
MEPLTPERRRAMTRTHLLEAAAIVFAKKGFHGASLDEVATAAGFTKGAVYSNFASKEDLFLALIDYRVDMQAASVMNELDESSEPGAGDERSRMRDLIESGFDEDMSALHYEFLAYAARNPEARAKLEATTHRQHEIVVGVIEQVWQRRGYEPGYPVDMLATIMLALFDGLATTRFLSPSLVTDDTLRQALELLYEVVDRDASGSPGR